MIESKNSKRDREKEGMCVTEAGLTCMSTPGAPKLKEWVVFGGLAHGNRATNKQTDEQMKMDEWRLTDECVQARTNKAIALTAGCQVL